MSTYPQAIELLRAKGYRLTPQRLLILSAVAEGSGHIGVDEVLRRARAAYPYIDVSTVYRTLNLFKRLGVVTEVAMGDGLHFELTDPHRRHHHMVCRACSRAFDLVAHYLEKLRDDLVRQFGFEPDLDNFTVSGVCADCAKRGVTAAAS